MQLVRRSTAQADMAFEVTVESATQKRHPVFGLSSAHLNELADYLGKGGRKMDAWFAMHRQTEVCFADDTAFVNMNTLADLQDWSAQ